MSDALEQQAEELEALESIYEGDTFFKQLNPTTVSYKYGEEDTEKSFLVEIVWTENYPNELPKINLDTFYNRNISPEFKEKIITILTAEAENWIGCGMVYTLFECLKEQLPELIGELEEAIKIGKLARLEEQTKTLQLAPSVIKTTTDAPAAGKKEQLTKSQKRRLWDKSDNKGVKPRGWDWVDIIRHLSQTGYKDDLPVMMTTTDRSVEKQVLAPPPNNY